MAKAKKEIRAIYKRVGFDPVEVTVKNELEPLQRMVGGYIETVRFAPGMIMLVDEEGLIDGRPVNFVYGGSAICGSVLWVGVKGENFDDVPYDLRTFRFKYPWYFEEVPDGEAD